MAQKIVQIAKDFNLKTKDVTDFLKLMGLDKKSGASLDDVEYEAFLAKITEENQAEAIDEYAEGTAKLIVSKPEKKAEPKVATPAPAQEAIIFQIMNPTKPMQAPIRT